ncbi:MAG TPA: RDD family protein [Burkholderiales bacterium]|nr:RDD family protein [Burkholderiales bacterium]
MSGETPGLARRLASLLYEAALVFAIAFFAGIAFLFASGAAPLEGWLLHAHQAFLLAILGAYFLCCWLRGGQTLAMKAWRIRLAGVTPARALARFLLAVVLVPTGIGLLWALVDRDRQFLHDRIAGTRLVRA